MSEDLTKKLPKSDSEKLSLILAIVQNLEIRVDRLEVRLNNLERRFDDLEKKIEERLYDTRPIWQKLVADIAQLQQGQRRMEETMSSEFREIKTSVRDINRRMSVMSDTMLAIQADSKDIDNRVHELELQQRHQSKPQT